MSINLKIWLTFFSPRLPLNNNKRSPLFHVPSPQHQSPSPPIKTMTSSNHNLVLQLSTTNVPQIPTFPASPASPPSPGLLPLKQLQRSYQSQSHRRVPHRQVYQFQVPHPQLRKIQSEKKRKSRTSRCGGKASDAEAALAVDDTTKKRSRCGDSALKVAVPSNKNICWNRWQTV